MNLKTLKGSNSDGSIIFAIFIYAVGKKLVKFKSKTHSKQLNQIQYKP